MRVPSSHVLGVEDATAPTRERKTTEPSPARFADKEALRGYGDVQVQEFTEGSVEEVPWEGRRVTTPSETSSVLEERGKRYGDFAGHASITQDLKARMRIAPGWSRLNDEQREALEMVAHKIGRILNGDPNYKDSWVDISGYSELVARRL